MKSKKTKKLEDDRQAFEKAMLEKATLAVLNTTGQLSVQSNIAVLDKMCITIQPIDVDSVVKVLEEHKDVIRDAVLDLCKSDKQIEINSESISDGSYIPLYHLVLQPVTKVEKIDIKNVTEEMCGTEKSLEFVPVEKVDEQIVYGIVYEPDTVDAQGDEANAEVIKKAAYGFMENAQNFKVMHKGKNVKVQILENYLAPVDFKINKRQVKKGTWILVTRILDKKLWKQIKEGNLTGYSMAGYAKVD